MKTQNEKKTENKKKSDIQFLIFLLCNCPDKNKRAVILESYISDEGPIPDEYGEAVRRALE